MCARARAATVSRSRSTPCWRHTSAMPHMGCRVPVEVSAARSADEPVAQRRKRRGEDARKRHTVAEPEDLRLVQLDRRLDFGQGEHLPPGPLDAADLRSVAGRHIAVPLTEVSVHTGEMDVTWRGPAKHVSS